MKPKTKLIWGLILVFFGMMLLGETTGVFDAGDLFRALLPLAFIAIGVWLIARRKKPVDPMTTSYTYTPPPPPPVHDKDETGPAGDAPSGEFEAAHEERESYSSSNYEETVTSESPSQDGSGKLKYSKTFGDMFIDCNGVNLQNVEVSAGIGDLEMKLHGAQLAEGLNRLIISSFIGDIRLYIPAEMPVLVHCSNFVGDIEIMGKRASGFGNSVDSQTANYQTSPKKLYIASNSFIGDIKIIGL